MNFTSVAVSTIVPGLVYFAARHCFTTLRWMKLCCTAETVIYIVVLLDGACVET